MKARITYRNVYTSVIDIWEGDFALAYTNLKNRTVYVAFDPMTSVVVNQEDFCPVQ